MAWQAIASVAGSLAQNFLNKDNADFSSANQYKYQLKLNKSNYKYNKKLIDYQNAFTERMYDKSVEQANSAHQREVEDLRKAGLNPILSATGGNGATTVSPVSSGNSQLSSSAGMPSVENPDLMSAYATSNQVKNDKRRVAYEEHNAHSLRNLQGAQTDLASSQSHKTNMETEYQSIVNNNLPDQLKYQNEQNAANVKKTLAETRAIDRAVARDDRESNARIVNYIASAGASKANSAKSYDDMKYRIKTDSTEFKTPLGTFGFSRSHNTNTSSKTGAYSTAGTGQKGIHYEKINGKTVPVRYF